MNDVTFAYVLAGIMVAFFCWWKALFMGEGQGWKVGVMILSFSVLLWPVVLFLYVWFSKEKK